MPYSSEDIKRILSETLSPDPNVRRNAECTLMAATKEPSHPLEVLKLVANATAPQDAAVRQAAAVHFKNIIKKGWDVNREDGNEGIVISDEDRKTIKDHVVQLMCTVPPQIQAQVSEAINLIAAIDFPGRWDTLLPQLVSQFGSPDPAVVNGVLQTIAGIFKRFRYVARSDELYTTILYSLKHVQAPLLQLFTETGNAVDAYANDPAQLTPRLESLCKMCHIFYSLNYQDLPEFFEDHIKDWMAQFSKYLRYKNPCVTDDDEETEPGPIDKLQAAIIQNLDLYASKDEECFLPFLGEFTQLVWALLMTVTPYPKHDPLATTSIKFLSALVSKLMHKNLFQEESTLREIILKIVIPQLMFRESDEELFEDDPPEFILTEVEGSDSASRRRCSQDLLRAMCRQFEAQTTAICSEHIGVMLAEYGKDPNNHWKNKDAAIHLMLGISIRKESSLGVSETNEGVNVMDFFNKHILPELQDTNHGNRPVVKATALKFVTTFRNQFSKQELVTLFPMLIAHLGSPVVVVHTFAAFAIERILVTKEQIGGKQIVFGNAELRPFLEPLLTSLFGIVDNADLNENDYVMKCCMRALATAEADVVPITQIVIEKLTHALARVAKNPRNPQFNHFLFESIAVLVRSVCSADPDAAPALEALLFPPFQTVLQMEILEFTPYVFQVLAQLLELRSTENGIGQYQGLFHPLMTPALWERKGNVPALTRLVQAYVMKAAPMIVQENRLTGVLGCFQKLLSYPAHEGDAFNLLNSLTLYIPPEAMNNFNPTIFQLLITGLQNAKQSKSSVRFPRFSRHLINFLALFVAKRNPADFFALLEALQPGSGKMLIAQVWLPRLQADPPKDLDAKIQVVGLTKLLCETPDLLNDPAGQQLWCALFLSVSTVLAATALAPSSGNVDGEVEGLMAADVQYDSAFTGLIHAKKPKVDPIPEIADASTAFAQAMQGFAASRPGRLAPLVQESLKDSDPKLSAGMQALFQQNGVQM